MFRRDKWWHREIERIRRDAAAREAELIRTICHLTGKPLPTPGEPATPAPEPVPRGWIANPDQLP